MNAFGLISSHHGVTETRYPCMPGGIQRKWGHTSSTWLNSRIWRKNQQNPSIIIFIPGAFGSFAATRNIPRHGITLFSFKAWPTNTGSAVNCFIIVSTANKSRVCCSGLHIIDTFSKCSFTFPATISVHSLSLLKVMEVLHFCIKSSVIDIMATLFAFRCDFIIMHFRENLPGLLLCEPGETWKQVFKALPRKFRNSVRQPFGASLSQTQGIFHNFGLRLRGLLAETLFNRANRGTTSSI